MARGATTKPSARAGKGPPSGKSNAVPSYKRFGKNLLRHGPDPHGNFLWVLRQGPQSEQALLSSKHIATSRTPENCEALRKFQNYISEECATVSIGLSYLQTDMGLDFLQYIKEDGNDFLKACDFLNKKSDGTKEADKVDRHVKNYLDFLQKLPNERGQQCRRLALHAARLYTLSTSLLEQAALVQYPSKWHASVLTKEQHEKCKAFARNGDDKHLKAWLRAVAADNVQDNQDAKKRATADATSDEAVPDESSPCSSCESTSSSGSSPTASSSDGKSKKRRGGKAKSTRAGKHAKKKTEHASKPKKDKKRKPSRSAVDLTVEDEAKKKKKRQPSPAAVELTVEDEEDEPEMPDTDLFLAWNPADLKIFAGEVESTTASVDKKDRFSLASLVAVLDAVPSPILEAVGLESVRSTLKTMSRLPKREKLLQILEVMQKVASKAQSVGREEAQEGGLISGEDNVERGAGDGETAD